MEEKSVCFNDVHLPFHDPKAVDLLLLFIKFFQPHNIFINGDLVDCWAISKFVKSLNIESPLKTEFQLGREFLKSLRTLCPKAKIIYIYGNHEFRFEKYLAERAEDFYDIRGMSIEEQLDCNKYGVEVVNNHQKENFYRYGHILIGHWDKACKKSGYTASNLLEEKGMSLIQAHSHRGAMVFKRTYQETMVAVENFCLCDLNPPYVSMPNWMLGFSTITTFPDGFFKINLRPIIEYKGQYQLSYGDKIFSV